MKFTVEEYRFTKRLTANHRTIEHFPSPQHTPYQYIAKGLFTIVPFTQYIMSTFQQNITRHKGKKKQKQLTLERRSRHQKPSQLWQECWNYQPRNFLPMISSLKVLMGKVGNTKEQVSRVNRGVEILRIQKY